MEEMNCLEIDNNAPSVRTRLAGGLYEWVESVTYAFIAIFLLFSFVFRVVGVEGASMVPTLNDNDWLVITNLHYQPDRGDIVVVTQPNNRHKTLIKRVIGLEGDRIYIDYVNHEVYVNDKLLDEPYINAKVNSMSTNEYRAEVPVGHVFVMGDNRNISLDSRSSEIGFIDNRYLLGKVALRIFPFGKFEVE